MIQKNNLFATFETQEELHKYFRSHTGENETFLLTLGAALMWNTIAHQLESQCMRGRTLDMFLFLSLGNF